MKKVLYVTFTLLMVASLMVSCAPPPAAPAGEVASTEVATPVVTEVPNVGVQERYMPDFPQPPEGTEMVDTTKYMKEPPWTIGYANASTANSFRIFTVAALNWIADQHPDLVEKVVHFNAAASIPKQVADMEDMIVQGVDVIILASESASALVPVVDQAMAAGIPVIILERGVEGDNWTTYIDVNPVGIATAQAQGIVDLLGGEGKIVTYGIIPGTTIAADQEGAIAAVLAKNPGVEQIAFDYGLAQLAKSKELMEAWIQSYPQIDGVLGWNGADVRGAIEALQEAERYDQVRAYAAKDEMGFLRLIAEEDLPGVGVTGFADCTIDAFNAAVRILSGQPVPKVWRLVPEVITKENVDQYYIPGAPDNWFPSRMAPNEVEKYLNIAATQ